MTSSQEERERSGELERRRREQQVDWMWQMVRDRLLGRLKNHEAVKGMRGELEHEVAEGELTSALGAERILTAFLGEHDPPA